MTILNKAHGVNSYTVGPPCPRVPYPWIQPTAYQNIVIKKIQRVDFQTTVYIAFTLHSIL